MESAALRPPFTDEEAAAQGGRAMCCRLPAGYCLHDSVSRVSGLSSHGTQRGFMNGPLDMRMLMKGVGE